MLHESTKIELLQIEDCHIEDADLKAQQALTFFKFVPVHMPGYASNEGFVLLIASAIVPWAFIPAHLCGCLCSGEGTSRQR